MQSISLLALTVLATTAHAAETFIGHDGATASAGGNTLGVGRMDTESGQANTVDVAGTAVVIAEAAIAKGAAIEVGADGKAKTLATGVQVARMAPDAEATAAGQRVEVILIAN